MDNNQQQGFPQNNYDNSQQGGYSEYGYPDQGYAQGTDGGGYYDPNQQGGYDPYSQGQGSSGGYDNSFDQYGTQQQGAHDPYSQTSGYDYGNAGYDNMPPIDYSQVPTPAPTSKSSGSQGNLTKVLLFVVPVLAAFFLMFALLLELGFVGMDSLKPSAILGIDTGSGDGDQEASDDPFADCVESGGEATVIYPEKCSINENVYFKNYTLEEEKTAIAEMENQAAKTGEIILKPVDHFKFNKAINRREGDIPEGVVSFTYISEGEESPYKMVINNPYLPATGGQNAILIEKVNDFITSGDGYDGEESMVLKALNPTTYSYATYKIGDLTVDYPGVDSVRALYTLDDATLASKITVRVFAKKNDNVLMLQKEINSDTREGLIGKYLSQCFEDYTTELERRECYIGKLSQDSDLSTEADKIVAELVRVFALS